MPKAILEYDLPEEQDDFIITSHAMDFALALFDLDDWLRSQIKYHGKEELQDARDQLFEMMEKYGVSLDMIP